MMEMSEIKVKVIGPEPPYMRCQAAKKVVERAAERIQQDGIAVKVEKVNILSKDVVKKYGILVSPAIAINGIVRVAGRVPSESEVENLIRSAVS